MNSSDKKTQANPTEDNAKADATAKTDTGTNLGRWQFTSLNLQSALNRWDQSAQHENTLPADEKQLQDVQNLLKELKNKLQEFE